MNEPYRLRYTNQIVGAFLLSLTLFVLAILWSQSGSYFQEPTRYFLIVTQDDVENLQKDAEVIVLGQRVGEVEDIAYVNGSDKIRIDLKMDPKKDVEIMDNASVQIERKFGFGTPVLTIRRAAGDRSSKPLPSGSQLTNFIGENDRLDSTAKEVEAMSNSVQKLQIKALPTMDSIATASDQFTESLKMDVNVAMQRTADAAESFVETNEQLRPKTIDTLNEIQSATKNLEARIDQLTETIEKLVAEDVRETLSRVRDSSDGVMNAAGSVERASATTSTEVTEALAKLQKTADEFEKLAAETREVVRIVREEAKELPGTTRNLNHTMDDAQDLVGEIRSHWLLRRYNSQPSASSQVPPSAVRGGALR